MSYKQQRKRKTRKAPQHQMFLPGKPKDPEKHNCRYCNNMQSLDNGEGGMGCALPPEQRDQHTKNGFSYGRKCFAPPEGL